MNKLMILAGLVVIALIPSVLLYLLFGELNEADVKWVDEGLQLGGPVAAFFVTLWFIARLYAGLSAPHPLQTQLENLEGAWMIESNSFGQEKRAAQSRTTMKIGNGNLKISGGTFRERRTEGSGGEGSLIGDWSAEIAVFDGHQLLYIYNLLDSKSNQAWKGIVRTTLDTSGKTPVFEGTWQVFGKNIHQGEIHMKKIIQ